MRDYKIETVKRVEFIKNILNETKANGIIYANSGGKDCSLVSILCKLATDNILGVMMPCHSAINYGSDIDDAVKCAEKFNISNIKVDISNVKDTLLNAVPIELTPSASQNINPRLRMTVLYAIGGSLGYLVAGTGNLSERYLGYFTKYGDGGCDFNPIGDLTATEVFEFLEYLKAPESIIKKAPAAGLYDGQTDEDDMGITYAEIDEFIKTGKTNTKAEKIIKRYHAVTAHKRKMPLLYKDENSKEF